MQVVTFGVRLSDVPYSHNVVIKNIWAPRNITMLLGMHFHTVNLIVFIDFGEKTNQ